MACRIGDLDIHVMVDIRRNGRIEDNPPLHSALHAYTRQNRIWILGGILSRCPSTGGKGCQDDSVAHRSAGSRALLAEPIKIEALESEGSIRLPNGFCGRCMGYSATSPGRGWVRGDSIVAEQ